MAGEPAVRFVAIGDTGQGSEGQRAVASAVAAKCATARCDFGVMLGDNIYPSGVSSADDPQLKSKFEDIYSALNFEFYVVLGNHDYGNNGAGTDFTRGVHEVAYSQRQPKWKMPAAHYHFVKGDIEFFALDTNMQLFGRDDDQKANIPAWIAASTAPWKIALGHHPYKSNGPHGNAGNYDGLRLVPYVGGKGVKEFFDANVCNKVDLYLCGHDHSLQWLNDKCGSTTLAVSGAGSEVTTLPGSNSVAYQGAELGFMYITVTKQKLIAEIINEQGVLRHTATLLK
jgi:tartrate-resistant acid phosphatase type 5